MNPSTLSTTLVSEHHDFAEVHLQKKSNHHLLISTKRFNAGDIITEFHAKEIHKEASRYTVQTGENQHIILQPGFLQYINHSCSPNAFFNTTVMKLTALKNIEPGDEFTFFYPSTEWFMAEPFICLCGEENCIGTIRGAKDLDKQIVQQYSFTDFIQSKFNHQ